MSDATPSGQTSRQLVTLPSGLPSQFVRFLVVGGGNTALSLVAFVGLTEIGVPSVAAAPLAFGAGAANGYFWNRRWTFKARDSRRARVVYVIVQAVGAGATSLLVGLLTGPGSVGHIVAFLITVPLVTAAMFLANRRWTFAEVA